MARLYLWVVRVLRISTCAKAYFLVKNRGVGIIRFCKDVAGNIGIAKGTGKGFNIGIKAGVHIHFAEPVCLS